jgi:hypothetical protein
MIFRIIAIKLIFIDFRVSAFALFIATYEEFIKISGVLNTVSLK